MAPDVTVIVVSWNARDHIDACLSAVLGAGGAGVDLELLVVDNDSSDGTPEHIESTWPQAKLIRSGRNGGMAAGNNLGMQHGAGRAFLLLNSDAYLLDGALRTLLDRLDAEPPDATAAVAPTLRNVDGSPQRSVRGFPTPWRYATEFFYLRRIAPHSRVFNAFYGGGIDVSRPGWIDWATGACLLVPRVAVDDVGLMDEAYFMYGEEVDWISRMRSAGRRVAWEPRAIVTHVGGGSARTHWGTLYQRQLVNHLRFMARCEGASAARRTRRILLTALRLRAVTWRFAAMLPGDRAARRARAAAFADGARSIAAVDVDSIDPPQQPAWEHVERDPRSTR
jgi:GT2 family glycosyltransferase